MVWTVRGSNPDAVEIYRTRPDRSCAIPSVLYNGYRISFGGKAAGTWRWPSIPSRMEVKERVGIYLFFPSGTAWSVIGRIIRVLLRLLLLLILLFLLLLLLLLLLLPPPPRPILLFFSILSFILCFLALSWDFQHRKKPGIWGKLQVQPATFML